MGTTNSLSGVVTEASDAGVIVTVGDDTLYLAAIRAAPGQALAFSLRPEAIRLVSGPSDVPKGWVSLEARLSRVEFLGALTRLEATLARGTVLKLAELSQPVRGLQPDTSVTLAYDPAQVSVFQQ